MRDKIAVIYHSHSGNTQAAAELVAEGAREVGGFEVVLHNVNEQRLAPQVLEQCAGAAFGTPDYFSYPAGTMKTFIDDWLIAQRSGNETIAGMPIALLLTHGGGGRAKGPFEELFRRIGPQVGETLSIKGRPEGETAEACRQLGRLLATEARRFAGGG